MTDPTPKAVVVPVEAIEAVLRDKMHRTSRLYSVRTGERRYGVGGHRAAAEAVAALIEAAAPQASLPPVEGVVCKYCGPGVITGLPGNACENCMGTGEDIEATAWAWVQTRYPNDAVSDIAFDAKEMVDAFIAGTGAPKAALSPVPSGGGEPVATWHKLDDEGGAELRVRDKRITSFPSYSGAQEAAERINTALFASPDLGDLAGLVERLTDDEPCAATADRAARALRSLAADRDKAVGLLRDPTAVHINMLRGGIAKLTPEQIGHLYRGDDAVRVVSEVQRQNPDAFRPAHREAQPEADGGAIDGDWQSIAAWMGFAASAIKAGELWSDQCQREFDEAKAAFARLNATPTPEGQTEVAVQSDDLRSIIYSATHEALPVANGPKEMKQRAGVQVKIADLILAALSTSKEPG